MGDLRPFRGDLPASEEECSDEEALQGSDAGVPFTRPRVTVG